VSLTTVLSVCIAKNKLQLAQTTHLASCNVSVSESELKVKHLVNFYLLIN